MHVWKAQKVRQDCISQRVFSPSLSIFCLQNQSLIVPSYVQMLERQHAQLIAGLQELYRRTQSGEGWTGATPEPVNYGQPLTHKILEALGVLNQDEWDDNGGPDGSTWTSFEQQAREQASMYVSSPASPETQATYSPVSSPSSGFPDSSIMSKRRSKYQSGPMPAYGSTLPMPSVNTTFVPYTKTEFPYTPYTGMTDSAYPTSATMPSLHYNDHNMDYNGDQGRMLNMELDWTFGSDDMFENSSGHGMPLRVGV